MRFVLTDEFNGARRREVSLTIRDFIFGSYNIIPVIHVPLMHLLSIHRSRAFASNANHTHSQVKRNYLSVSNRCRGVADGSVFLCQRHSC